ncbi:MAG TPA: efflux RND transporter permease subunit [Verrucomicrobiae bacterium]
MTPTAPNTETPPGTASPLPTTREPGGLARFFVEHREVSWLALAGVLIWGALVYGRLAQQEDPTIPHRTAMLVTVFPGATASKVEELLTKPIERKVSEMQSVEEIKSQSRPGVSTLTIKLTPGSEAYISQEWDKMRAKLAEVALPQGARAPFLNTDFGNTVTLLFALTSPPITEAECVARAQLIRDQLADLPGHAPTTNRAAVIAFFPPGVAQSYREVIRRRFETEVRASRLADAVQTRQGQSFILADLATSASRQELEQFTARFVRQAVGSDKELWHPDFTTPILLLGDEDPLPRVRSHAPPRYSYRDLERQARQFEDALKQLESVGKVTKIGIVQETVYLLFSDANVTGYGLTPESVIEAIAARNAVIPGGTMRTEGRNFPVQISGEYPAGHDEELLGTVVGVGRGGAPVYLRDLFEVRHMYESPIPYKVDVLERDSAGAPLTERRAVMVAVEMKDGKIISRFNEEVRRLVDSLKPRLPEGMRIQTLSDQPAAVAARIHHFARCFLEAVLIVIVVALFLMDWRSALVVATAIPLTVALTLVGMYLLRIPLHQISIAALIIALGMLVDVPVVASDGINRALHSGEPRLRAAWLGPFRLRHPMVFGTLINIVAFLPLLLLPGDKGAFISGLPIVVTLALASALLVSVTFTPLVGYYVLRGQKGLDEGAELRSFFLFRLVDQLLQALLPRYRKALESALRRPGLVLATGYTLLALSFALVPLLGTQFFPPAERNQLLVDIEVPATDSLTSMRQTVDRVTTLLKTHAEVASAAVFTGGTAPRFYYNVAPREPADYLAQILINTRGEADVPRLIVKLRSELDRQIPGARCVVKQLEQGPPVEEPIQIRLSGEDLDTLGRLSAGVAATLRAAGGYQVHDDLGLRMPNLRIDIDQDRANSLGIGNRQIGLIAQAAFAGIKVTELRDGDRLIPVVIRLRVEDRSEAEKIRALYVQTLGRSGVPLDSFAALKVQPEFVTIPHFNQLRTVTVKAYAPFGELPSRVLDRARAGLKALELPAGYRLSLAGEDLELRQNRAEMGLVLKVSLALITLAMVLQFNSVVKSVVVMLTVPLGVIGALAGLALSGSPLGFTALLGIVSLAGVVVSHIIVLSDFIEQARASGMPLEQALVQAGLARLRPVLVTVLATVGGLIPLFLTGGALWHPLTAVHIFGLLLATVLTLVMLPVLYYVFCAKLKLIKAPKPEGRCLPHC